MPRKDYYELLGISRSAGPEEIKRAYHRLAHQFHPDKNPGNRAAEEHFKAINEAYAVLQDGQKRAAYDRHSLIVEERFAPRFDEFEDPYGRHPLDDLLEVILEGYFGGPRSRARNGKGGDCRVQMEITLEEVAFGATKEVRVPQTLECPVCQGSRCAPGTGYGLCPSCKGAGSFRGQKGFFIVDSACGRCQGQGKIVVKPCSHCAGRGYLKVNRGFRVRIPAGVEHGSCLRIRGLGNSSRSGGQPGDLFLDLSVKKHPFFERQGDDLLCEVSITRGEARRGTTVEVPTLNGPISLKIPPRTPSGKAFTLKGQGIPSLEGKGRGDQKITILVS